uniref:hypothetical protein n=1 Tax=Escherichia coli TaxID=562 RepID=UPI00254CF0B5
DINISSKINFPDASVAQLDSVLVFLRWGVRFESSRMHHLLPKISFKNISFLNNYFIHFLNFLLLRHQRQNQAITLK